jgi:hypothetical protein
MTYTALTSQNLIWKFLKSQEQIHINLETL